MLLFNLFVLTAKKIFERRKGKTHLINKKTKITFCSLTCSGHFYAKDHERNPLNVIRVFKIFI